MGNEGVSLNELCITHKICLVVCICMACLTARWYRLVVVNGGLSSWVWFELLVWWVENKE